MIDEHGALQTVKILISKNPSNAYAKLWEKNISDEVLRTFIKRVRLKTSKELIENISAQGYLISVLNN